MSKKKDTKEFPSLPQSSNKHPATIGDTIRIGGAYVSVKHEKKKGGGGQNTSNNSKNSSSSSSSNNIFNNNGLSDKANDHLSRINKNFEFAKNLKENKILTNCTTCGRIITAEDGFGPCPFCQTNITPDVVNQYFNSADDHCLPKNKQGNEDYQKALELRNRLLRWDENYSQTTAVIDEQAAEYGNSSTAKDIWLSESEKKSREKIEERIKELKEQMKNKHGQPLRYTFDFAGKRILLDESHQIETQKELDKLIESLKVSTPKNKKEDLSTGVVQKSGSSVGMQRSALLDVTKLKFIESKDKKQKPEQPEEIYNSKGGIVQNPYFDTPNEDSNSEKTSNEGSGDTIDGLEPIINYSEPISTHEDDSGMCMSMHQPWASLLVHGIKIHEGRSWPTDHRGRLWIASTAEEPTPEGIEELESYYKNDFDRTQGYPKHYPTSVILGCVDVIDCLSYEEYCNKFSPEEQESESDYVFICANPRRLFLPYPISGRPKIYKLSKEQLENCQLGLKPLPNKTM